MAAKKIESIEGIGPVLGAKLREAGCHSPSQLLKDAGSASGRKAVAEKTGISESVLLRCVNMADLFRVSGVASQYAELLEASGVDTVKELQHRNAENLADKMREINAQKRLCRLTPGTKRVEAWIEQAKTLPPMVSH